MLIDYIWWDNPQKVKRMNSVVQRRADDAFSRTIFHEPVCLGKQEKYDAWLLEKLKRQKEQGLCLSYSVMQN